MILEGQINDVSAEIIIFSNNNVFTSGPKLKGGGETGHMPKGPDEELVVSYNICV